ncbi:Uncharacterized protein QTN25_001667 [Entamoeba marina]
MSWLLLITCLFISSSFADDDNFGMFSYVNPIDFCKGNLCRFRVKHIIKKATMIEKQLHDLDRIERHTRADSEHNLLDLQSLQNRRDHYVISHHVRQQSKLLRRATLTRVKLLRLLRKLLGNLSPAQQARVVRYVGLEHRVPVSYDDLSERNVHSTRGLYID